ncbi:MAG: HlyD family secretion protein [Alphaproteobacteria bacterium]|nr:HlyD family secretion protein [Alphaproteobacteria bacterium]
MLAAAEAETASAEASLRLAERRLADLTLTAPAAGTIEALYHRAGETVAAGAPILALLPADGLRVRFFVPERRLSSFRLGQRVRLSCDGCPDGMTGRISHIAAEPQFTPPVIYSLTERAKLVFLLEATPEGRTPIRPGLPVDVSPEGGGGP